MTYPTSLSSPSKRGLGQLSRAGVVYIWVVAGALALSAAYGSWLARRPGRDAFEGMDRWTPTRTQIARAVGRGGGADFRDRRHRTFARMFQQRYRNRAVIVGLQFLDARTISVKCLSSIPRPIMKRIALRARFEAKALFGRNYAVVLYETNGLGKRKLAEVRKDARTGRLAVVFDPRFAHESEASAPTAEQVVRLGARDCYRPVYHPRYTAADRAGIQPGAFVIGYAHAGEAHAYALNLMDRHELVNDTVGGQRVLVSWCSLCHTAAVYSRDVDGRTLTFGMTGELLNNVMVMYDRETDSRWSQITGEAFAGRLKGRRLRMLVSTPRITWTAWRGMHPSTVALSVGGEEDSAFDPDRSYEMDPDRVGVAPFRRRDERAHPKEMVLGVLLGKARKAYPLARLQARRLIEDRIGRRPVLVWCDRASAATAVYEPPGPGPYRLEGGVIVGPGGRWQAATGQSLSGGGRLKPVTHMASYWFGWSAFYPRTGLYGG